RGVGITIASESARLALGGVTLQPPRVIGERARGARNRTAPLHDERAVTVDGCRLPGAVDRPVPAPPAAVADDAGHRGGTRGEPVPARVDLVERDEGGAREPREVPGEHGLAGARAAVDEQHPGVRPGCQPSRERGGIVFGGEGGIRALGPAHSTHRQLPSSTAVVTAAATTPSPTSMKSTSRGRSTERRAQLRRVAPPNPRASIAVASLPPRRTAKTSSVPACTRKRRMPCRSATPRARRAS